MHAFLHQNSAFGTDCVHADQTRASQATHGKIPETLHVTASKVDPGKTTPPGRVRHRLTGTSCRPSRANGGHLAFALIAALLLLLGVLAEAQPAQAQSRVIGVPAAPQELTATREDGGIVLTWSAPRQNGDSNILYYQMRSAEGASVPDDQFWISVGLTTSGAFRRLTNGTLYTFQVRAVNSQGAGHSAVIQATPEAVSAVSLRAVRAAVTEGTDAVFRFRRSGNTTESLTVGVDITGHEKVMSAATRTLAENPGASPDTTVTFDAGETEVRLALTSEADNENEGDGNISISVRNSEDYDIDGARKATVLIEDDDIPVVSLRWVSPQVTLRDNVWAGSIVEGQEVEFEVVCSGGSLAPDGEIFRIPLRLQRLMNHPLHGYNYDTTVRYPCSHQPHDQFTDSLAPVRQLYVGPDNGRIEIDLFGQVLNLDELPGPALSAFPYCYGRPDDVRFCPKFELGAVTTARIEVLNRNPTVTVEALDEEVNEGEPARFKLTRIWTSDWLQPEHLFGASTTIDFTTSSVGGYVDSPPSGQETFGPFETETVFEVPTASDGVQGDDGTVTFEILAGSQETQSGNIGGHYEVYDHIDGVTPPGGSSRVATVRVLNRDEAGVDVSASALTVPEGDSRTYTVALRSQPEGTVTVTPSAAGSPDVTISPATLTFTAASWNQAQTVTVSAAQDDDAADDAATVSHTASGGGYGSVTASGVAVTVADDETASTGVVLSVSPDMVDEDAGAATVAVTGVLDAAPRSTDTEVTVSVSAGTASSGDFAAVSDFALTIPAGRTSGTAVFSLTPVDDAIDEDAETVSVSGAAQGLAVTAASVTIQDNDARGVDLSASALTVSEGGNRTYTVALRSQPEGPVTVVPSVAGSPDVTVRPARLTFTAANWNQAQTVTVSAAQDDDATDDAATVSHEVSGGDYDSVTASGVAVTVADDETASTGVVLSVSPDTIDEDAGATTVAVTGVLNGAPRSADTGVTVSVSAGTASAGDFAAVSDFALTIPAGRTSGTASFSLTPVDDAVEEGAETISVSGTAQGLAVTAATVTIEDDDRRGVNISAGGLTVPEGESHIYTVALRSQPEGPVTVVPSVSGSPDVTVSPATLTFTTANWKRRQSVTVSAAQDDDATDDAATVSHTASGGGYSTVRVPSIPVTVRDDDTALQAPELTTARPGFELVRLEWTALPDGGPVITGYEVHVERVDDGTIVRDWEPAPAHALTGHDNSVTGFEYRVTGLENDVAYRFRVRAVSQFGPGAPSNALIGTPVPLTLTIVPLDGVDTVVEGEPARFDVVFSVPATQWLELNVAYTNTGDMMETPTSRNTRQIGPNPTRLSAPREVATVDDGTIEPDGSVTLTLLPGDGYRIGEPSSATVRILDNDGGRAPAAVSAPALSAVSPTSLEASWNPPSDRGNPDVIDGYDVQYREAGEAGWSEGPIGVAETQAVLEGLETGIAYEVRVLARNAHNPRNADHPPAENWSTASTGGTAPSTAPSTTPSAPAAVIADATVEEGPGAVLVFPVTLERAAPGTVTVDWRTQDGTATAGEDYEQADGTLTFAPGETAKSIEIAVFDDSHEEGRETMFVFLSNPSGASVADVAATGYILNSDAMPQGWLGRFGRTVADQVLDAVESRLASPRTQGTELTVAGQRIDGIAAADAGAPEKGGATADLEAFAGWARDNARLDGEAFRSRPVTERELMTSSSFALTGGSAETGFGSLWGRGAVSRFDGREGALALDGEVTSTTLGADFTRGNTTAGLAVSHSRGEGAYRGANDGTVETSLTGVYPYVRHELSEGLSLWGVAGYGSGTLALMPEGNAAIETGLSLSMAAAGGRGVLVQAPADGGLELAAKADALLVRTASDAQHGSMGSLAAETADVTRFRLGVEGTWRGLDQFVPRFEIGVRHDGGDAETGLGADVGGGLSWTDASLGLQAEVRARGLLTREAGGFRERGFAGALSWDPTPASDLGPSISFRHAVGAEASGGVEALLRPETLRIADAADDKGDGLGPRTFGAKFGYGFAMFGGHLTGSPELGLGWREGQLETTLGWRLSSAQTGAFELGFEASRLEAANDDAELRVGARLQMRF